MEVVAFPRNSDPHISGIPAGDNGQDNIHYGTSFFISNIIIEGTVSVTWAERISTVTAELSLVYLVHYFIIDPPQTQDAHQ